MLNTIIDLPEDKRIAGVHCIPITENGTIVMAWDKEEKLLTTIGGRIEENESIDEALEREAMEEVGMTLSTKRIPFASWYWQASDTYTVWFLVKAISDRHC
ncbi:NUDIX domain-containing protein [Psychrobacillus sp. FSL H8-0484]|uniref:NUDIX hydrolase n=1 Tax=Psychrobacillus sp. FSL H8-0484 TaxID=2921390 RepID=UPI0030F76711